MDINAEVKQAIERAIEGSIATVSSRGGHFEIKVVSSEFAGKSLLAKQRLVYTAITPLMSGANAPVHAVDRLETLLPE